MPPQIEALRFDVKLRRATFALFPRMPFLFWIVNVGRSQINIARLLLIHRMIRLARRRWTSRPIRPPLIDRLMRIDLARRLAVFYGLVCTIRIVGGCGLIVVQPPHAAFGLWLGPLVAAAGI